MSEQDSTRRGSYKEYENAENILVPISTLRYRHKRKAQTHLSDEESSSVCASEDSEVVNVDVPLGKFKSQERSLSDEESSVECTKENSGVLNVDVAHGNLESQEISLLENIDISNQSDDCSNSTNEISFLSSDDEDDNEFYNENPCDTSEDENECDDRNIDNLPLFEGVDISRNKADLIIMAYSLRHNLTDAALESQLQLIDCFLPAKVFKTKYRFLKSFPTPEYQEYYYCECCSVILKTDESNKLICRSCNNSYNEKILKEKGKYFTYIPLTPQLENFVKSKFYIHIHNQNSENESDIINGNIYRQLRDNNIIENTTLTLTCNTDGVSLSKSSKLCMWPIFVSINELPYRIRRNNMILCGLYVGYDKPDMNMYLEPFAEELKDLSDTGFSCRTYYHEEPVNIKVYTLLCSVDSIARAAIQNVKQFNGKYGCSYCYQEGERVQVGSGFARIYSYDVNVEERCSELHENDVEAAVQKGEIIKGVKGPSIMSLVPFLDIINGYPPEYMHSCIIGVGKLFGLEWFDSKNSAEPWYLGLSSKEFNEKLLNIKPPCEVTRTP